MWTLKIIKQVVIVCTVRKRIYLIFFFKIRSVFFLYIKKFNNYLNSNLSKMFEICKTTL